MKTCLLLLRKVKKESELPLKENVPHLLHHLTHPLDDSNAQPVQISLLSLPPIGPFKKKSSCHWHQGFSQPILYQQRRTGMSECFLLPEKATSPLKKRKLQRNTPALTLIQCCLPTPVQLQSLCRAKVPTCQQEFSLPNSSSSYLHPLAKTTLTGILSILHQSLLGALPRMLHPPRAPLLLATHLFQL